MKNLFYILIVAVLITACAQATPTAAPTSPAATTAPTSPAATTAPTSPAATTAPTAAKQVVINWWHVEPETVFAAYWQSEANKYMQAHPNVKIVITAMSADDFKTKLATQMEAGTPPDLFHTWDGGTLKPYIDAGMVQDITASVTANNNAVLNEFTSSVQNCNYGGKYYCTPWDVQILGVLYNKGLFQKAGITDTPTTWAQFLDDVKKLKSAGITPMAVGAKDNWPAHFIYTYLMLRDGGTAAFNAAVAGTGKFTDQPFVEAGQQMQQLLALNPYQNGFMGASYNDEVALEGNCNVAMAVGGTWYPTAMIQAATDGGACIKQNLGFFAFPSVPNGPEPTAILGVMDGFAVGKNAPPETVDFLNFLNSPAEQRIRVAAGLSLPSAVGLDDALPPATPWMVQAIQIAEKAQSFQLVYDQKLPPDVAQVVYDATNGIFGGTLTPQQAAQLLETAMAKDR